MPDLFADVKVGDVFFRRVGFSSRLRKEIVTRVTSTRLYNGDTAYRKSDGRQIGERGFSYHIDPATPDLIAQYEKEQAEMVASKIIDVAIDFLSKARGDEAIRLAALLPPELKGTKNG